MKKIEIKYWTIIVLSLACLFTITDTIITFPHDLYAIFMGQFWDIPLGFLLVIVSTVVQKKEINKTKWKKNITITGIILGLVTIISPIVLFNIGMAMR